MGVARILMVDDNPINLMVLEELLGDEYQVLAVTSGEAALSEAPAFHPDLVLLDVMMPGMDGLEVCRRLRRDPDLCAASVIMVSALADADDVAKGLAAGADEYVTKPFEMAALRDRVRKRLVDSTPDTTA